MEQHKDDKSGNDTVRDVVCVRLAESALMRIHEHCKLRLQVKGMQASTMKAGKASPIKSQLILVAFSIIMAPTMTRTDPVAQDGMLLKMGAKKMLTKNQKLVAIAVNPVFPPSAIPLADSVARKTVRLRMGTYEGNTESWLTDERCARRGTEEQSRHGDTSRVDQESHRASLKVTVPGVEQASLLGHGDKSTGCVEQIDVQERDLDTSMAVSAGDSDEERVSIHQGDPGLAVLVTLPVDVFGPE